MRTMTRKKGARTAMRIYATTTATRKNHKNSDEKKRKWEQFSWRL